MAIPLAHATVRTAAGEYRLEHHSRFDAKAIVGALESEPLSCSGNTPMVREYAMGRLHVASRAAPLGPFDEFVYSLMARSEGFGGLQPEDFEGAFRHLQETVGRKGDSLIVEFPVAKVAAPDGRTHYVTLWKTNTSGLDALFRDSSVSVTEKVKAARNTMDLIARLHAIGFVHQDIHPGNIRLTLKTRRPHFVDWLSLRKTRDPTEREWDVSKAITELTSALGRECPKSKLPPELKQQLNATYRAALTRYERH